MKDWILILLYGVVIIAILSVALIRPYFEAKAFNECTGGHASYTTALFTELRVQDCK